MSWWASLCDPVTGDVLELDEPHQMRGGTYAIGGTRELGLHVTYNYSALFRAALGGDGLNDLHGRGGAESIAWLIDGAAALGDEVDPDYWKAVPGNAKRALLQLLAMARMRPDGVWRVS